MPFPSRVALMGGISSSDSDVRAWITAVGANNTNQVEVSILTTMVVAMKADGSWAKLDRLWIYALSTQTAAGVDLVARATHTLVNSPTFTANKGFTGDGSTSSINSNLNLSTATNYQQNTACIGGWIQTNDSRTSGNPCYFGNSSQAAGGTNLTRQSATQNNFCLNDGVAGADNATMNPTNGTGLNHMDRTASNAISLYQNGVSVGSAVTASTTVTNAVLRSLATDNGSGSAVLFNNGTLGSLFAGASMGATIAGNFFTDMHVALHALSATNFP